MKVIQIQFAPWDKEYNFLPGDNDVKPGDLVVVKTELGTDLGEVVGMIEVENLKTNEKGDVVEVTENSVEVKSENGRGEVQVEKEVKEKVIKPIVRKAILSDIEKQPKLVEKKQALDFCKKMKEKYDLPMKFIDVHFSYDGSRITFAFIADGRVDFRELVKDLTRHFGRTIRLQQIGIRDEAKIMGDYGHCGNNLCCKKFLKDLTSITSEMAEVQQCSHRGSERISGVCGRLMCCLSYEQKGYDDMSKKMPPIGAKVDVDGVKGIIVGHNILKQSVNVEFPGENGDHPTVLEVDLNRNKKKKDS